MNFAVRLTPEARQDITRLAKFLATKSPAAMAKARAALKSGIEGLRTFPNRGAVRGDSGERELLAPFGRDGYVIQYLVEGRRVTVLRIFHAREDR